MDEHYPFSLPPLPWGYDALVPELNEQTLLFHHDKHFAAYVDNLNKLLADYPTYQTWPLCKLCQDWPGGCGRFPGPFTQIQDYVYTPADSFRPERV